MSDTTRKMTYAEAEDFFSEFYSGKHHIPGKIKEWGWGWFIVDPGSLATYDFDQLTRLVFMAHERCVRVEILPAMRYLKIAIHPRRRSGDICVSHPDLITAIKNWKPEMLSGIHALKEIKP